LLTRIQNNTATLSSATAEKSASGQRVFDVPIKNSLLEPKHYRAMGDALWLFVWCVDHVTKEVSNEKSGERIGRVLGTMPQCDENIAGALGCSARTVRRWRHKLVRGGYLGCRRTPNGHTLWVRKSKKWANRTAEGQMSDRPQLATHSDIVIDRSSRSSDRSGRCKNDFAVTSPKNKGGASRHVAAKDVLKALCAEFPERLVNRAYEDFRGDQDPWLKSRQYPVNYFRKHFEKYALPILEGEYEAVSTMGVLDIRPPELLTAQDRAGLEKRDKRAAEIEALQRRFAKRTPSEAE
jgi:hypothetical protein